MTGLLTFIHADNYGALLQAYALQKTLNEMGHDSVFLNFDQPGVAAEKDLSHVPAPIRKKMEENIRNQKLRSARFEDFRKRYLFITEALDPKDDATLDKRFEKFIVGSDQVFNSGITGGDPVYALAFADPKKRYSYAASFGGSEGVEKAGEYFWKELSRFQKISLREDTAVQACRAKAGIEPMVHVDPCLLQTGEQWRELLEDDQRDEKALSTEPGKNTVTALRREEGKSGETALPANNVRRQEPELMTGRDSEVSGEGYVLLFLITYDEALVQKAKQCAGEHDLGLKVVTASYMPMFGYESFTGTGVTDWLRLIRDAGYIFCDSFHAAVFSILFEKPFYLNISGGSLAGRSARLVQLLDLLGLEANQMNEGIDYGRVKQIIGEQREKGLQYLKSI